MQREQSIRSATTRASQVVLAPEPKVEEFCTKVFDLPGMICADQAGSFVVRYKSGNNYLIDLYDHNDSIKLTEIM